MSKLLSAGQWDVICCVEEYHDKHGEFPSLRFISQKTGIPQVKVSEYLQNEVVQRAFENRGIDWKPSKEKNLTPKQIAAIHQMVDISDIRPIKEKLADVGVKPSQWYGWKKQRHFMEAYRQAAEKLYGESIPEIHKSIIQEAINGSFNHQKLILAMTGIYDERKQDQLDIRWLMTRVLEVIQKHVSDPTTLEQIASEFESLLAPQKATIKGSAIGSIEAPNSV